MVRIVWSRRIIQDIYAAAEYHAAFSPSFAKSLTNGIFAKVALLETHPLMGRRVPESVRSDLRELLYKQYRIIYQVVSKSELLMVALHHSAQPLQASAFAEE